MGWVEQTVAGPSQWVADVWSQTNESEKTPETELHFQAYFAVTSNGFHS